MTVINVDGRLPPLDPGEREIVERHINGRLRVYRSADGGETILGYYQDAQVRGGGWKCMQVGRWKLELLAYSHQHGHKPRHKFVVRLTVPGISTRTCYVSRDYGYQFYDEAADHYDQARTDIIRHVALQAFGLPPYLTSTV